MLIAKATIKTVPNGVDAKHTKYIVGEEVAFVINAETPITPEATIPAKAPDRTMYVVTLSPLALAPVAAAAAPAAAHIPRSTVATATRMKAI